MSTATIHPGATASGHVSHSRHLVGQALRAVRVVAETAIDIVVLGRIDEQDPTLVRRRLR
ncbi:hypothetical protein E1265_30285 [Streptomyces sp. 8K308]|uniref:hypothetical protein n=1 Tax=Streptomyces sp. 8K308 TaxID=2530388 RepID=UPI00104E5A97|nr:hypothetical protein [Streptomyces sp. 8K308]TDC11201.1 hypothetical protein E1265_30285 [Streptomyces sp. 8K308]